MGFDQLLKEIRACQVCEAHQSGVPWDDASGERLRSRLKISIDIFYDPHQVAIVPIGFCYPGKGKQCDLPPRKECQPLWHQRLFDQLPHLKPKIDEAYVRRTKRLTQRAAR